MTDPVHFSDAVRPSKESLRCLWLGLTRVSFSTLDKIFEMGPERCRYALQTDRPYSPSLRALCRHTLAYPHCQKLRYILNEKAWPTYEDDGARSRSREKRAALLEVMGRRELLLSTAHGCAPAYVLTRLLADGYRAAHVRESHLAVSSLRGMLVLWRHAAGAGYISMLMRQMLAESVLFGPHSAALEGGVLTAFAEAGGQLSAGEIACALLAASKSAHHGPYTRARAGGATAARQKRATRLIEDAGLQGALAPFSPSDQRWLQELFPGAEYGGALCLRARQMAADPAAPAPRSRGNPRPGHSRGLEGR